MSKGVHKYMNTYSAAYVFLYIHVYTRKNISEYAINIH